jgi:tetraacyldisaccharide-1-P 4'-kinase
VEDADLSDGDFLANKVNVDLYMLHSSVMNGIHCHVDKAHIIVVDDGHRMKRLMKLLDLLSYPATWASA